MADRGLPNPLNYPGMPGYNPSAPMVTPESITAPPAVNTISSLSAEQQAQQMMQLAALEAQRQETEKGKEAQQKIIDEQAAMQAALAAATAEAQRLETEKGKLSQVDEQAVAREMMARATAEAQRTETEKGIQAQTAKEQQQVIADAQSLFVKDPYAANEVLSFEDKLKIAEDNKIEYDPQKDLAQNYMSVGSSLPQPEYMSKAQYDEIIKWATENNLNVSWIEEIIKKNGVSGFNDWMRTVTEREIAETEYITEQWEKDVLPTLPDDLQNSYNSGKSTGDFTTYVQLTEKYQTDYDKWITDNIKSDSELNKVLTERGEAQAIKAWDDKQSKILAEFEQRIETEAPEMLKKAYKDGGLEGYSAALKEYESEFDKAIQITGPYSSLTEQDLKLLVSSTRKDEVQDMLKRQRLDISKYIKEKPIQQSVEVLKILGYSKEIVADAQGYVTGVRLAIREIDENPGKWMGKLSSNIATYTAIEDSGMMKRGTPGLVFPGEPLVEGSKTLINKGTAPVIGDFKEFWTNLSQEEKQKLVTYINDNPNKDNDFAAIMQRFNKSYDNLPVAAQFIVPFIPYVGMPIVAFKGAGTSVQKKVTGQEVGGLEWLMDGAMVGLSLAGPLGQLAGKSTKAVISNITKKVKIPGGEKARLAAAMAEVFTTKGIVYGSQGIFAANMIKTWGDMSTGERATNLAMFMVPTLPGAVRKVQFFKTLTRRDYTPLRSMSTEASTIRIKFTDKELVSLEKAGIKEADILAAGDDINQQLMSGKKEAVVKLGAVTKKVKNTIYMRLMRGKLFSATPDMSQVGRGGDIPVNREFFLSPKVAIEPMQRSYLTGQKAVNPGIIEVLLGDPNIIRGLKIGQRRMIDGGKTLELEVIIPGRDVLEGKGFRLEPVPGPAGRGHSFDESLGEIEIRRFNLVKVKEHGSGLIQVKTGITKKDGGVVGVGDLHGTNKFKEVFDDVNTSFDSPLLKGNPNDPKTWHIVTGGYKGRTLVFLGDLIDRGVKYKEWRTTINRLVDEAKTSGNKVVRLLGNHELAYLSGDVIEGITYTDMRRNIIKNSIMEDIKAGRAVAAVSAEGKLFTHAGVNLKLFPEYKGKSPELIAKDLNEKFLKAVKADDYDSKLFSKGRVEKGHSLLSNERKRGGIFWTRPQESAPQDFDLGFVQVVGHNPGVDIRRIWGANFIEADVSRRTGGTGVYRDTPYIKTISTEIIGEKLKGTVPDLGNAVNNQLKIAAMKDTIADIFMGWDGRIQAIKNLAENKERMKLMLKQLEIQASNRMKAGDSYGAAFIQRKIADMTSSTAKEYFYGDIGFWRDIVMGRQNSVRSSMKISKGGIVTPTQAGKIIDPLRSKIEKMAERDVNGVFGNSKKEIIDRLKLDNRRLNDQVYLKEKLDYAASLIDDGLAREILPYLDQDRILSEYRRRLSNTEDAMYREGYVDISNNEERGSEYRGYEYRPRETARRGDRITEGRYEEPKRERGLERRPATRSPARRPNKVERTPSRAPVRTPVRIPTVVSPRPPRVPPPGRTYGPPPPPPPPGKDEGTKDGIKSKKGSKVIPPGSITWSAGRILMGTGKNRVLKPVWKYIPPPYNILKPITLFHAPVGAKSTANRPGSSLQIIGASKASVPEKILVDMGIKDIEVVRGQDISFASDGEHTNVGTRLGSPTSGLSINEEGDYVPDVDLKGNVKTNKHSKPVSNRGKVKENKLTSMKGMK